MNRTSSVNSIAVPPEPMKEEQNRRLHLAQQLLVCHQKALNHEFPNSLIGIQGLIQTLDEEEGMRLSAKGRDYLARLADSARRLQGLVSALARIGRLHLQPPPAEKLCFLDVAREAIAEVNHLLSERKVEYRLPDASLSLSLPRAPLRQILVQLLWSAVGRAEDDRPLYIDVGVRARPSAVEISVADDGRPWSTEQQERLFEPFTGGRTDGGLGLFFVRCLVESWGGEILVQSEPSRGCAITIRVANDGKTVADG